MRTFLTTILATTAVVVIIIGWQPTFLTENSIIGVEFGFALLWLYLAATIASAIPFCWSRTGGSPDVE